MTRFAASPWALLFLALAALGWFGSLFSTTSFFMYALTITEFIAFLLLFLLHRDAQRSNLAQSLKIDELLFSVKEARDEVMEADNMPEEVVLEELDDLHKHVKSKD